MMHTQYLKNDLKHPQCHLTSSEEYGLFFFPPSLFIYDVENAVLIHPS